MADFWKGFGQGFGPAFERSYDRARSRREKAEDRTYAEEQELEKLAAQARGMEDVAHELSEEARKTSWKEAFPNREFIPLTQKAGVAQTKKQLAIRDAIVQKHKADRLLKDITDAKTRKAAEVAHKRAKEISGSWEDKSDIQKEQFNKTFGLKEKQHEWEKGQFKRQLEEKTAYDRKVTYDDAKELINAVKHGTSPYIEWMEAREEGKRLIKAIMDTDTEHDERAKVVGLAEALESIKAKWLDGSDSVQAKNRQSAITKQRDAGGKDIDALYKSWNKEKEPNFNPKDLIQRVFLDQDNVIVPFDESKHNRSDSWERIFPDKRNEAMQMYSHVVVHKIDPVTEAQTQSNIPAPVRLLPGEVTDPLRGGGQSDAEQLNRTYLLGAEEKIIPQEILVDGRLSQGGRDKVLTWLRSVKASDKVHPSNIKVAGRLLLPEESQFSKEFTPADWNKLDTASGLLKAIETLEGAAPKSLPALPFLEAEPDPEMLERKKNAPVGARINQGGSTFEKQKDGTWIEVKKD